MFVAVGHQGVLLSSPDGEAWQLHHTGKEGEVFRGVCFGAGRFVAVGTFGGTNHFAATEDGANWKRSSKDGQYRYKVLGIAYGEKLFLGIGGDAGSVGDSKPFMCTSPDGETWSDYAFISGKNILRRIVRGKDNYVGVGDRGRRAVSLDARKWEDAPAVKAIDTLIDVAYGAGRFVGVGLHGLRMSSVDGLTWTERLLGEEGEHLNSIVWAKDRFVAIGMGGTYFSPDGLKWERTPNVDAPLTATFGDGKFVGASWKGRLLLSTDAIRWKQVHKCEHHVEAVAYGSK